MWRRRSAACYGRAMSRSQRALFVDWGGTLALTRHNRTVVDEAGHPVLMDNVVATLARERPRFDVCFIVSNQARISMGEIAEAEVTSGSHGPTSSSEDRSPDGGCVRTRTRTVVTAASPSRGCSASCLAS